MYKYQIIILSILISAAVQGQDTLFLSLDKCRDMAIKNSEKLKIASENIRKAEGEKMAARAAWLPDISASATGLYRKTELNTELYLPTQNFNPQTGELVPNVLMDPTTGQPVVGPDGNPVFNTYAYMPLDVTIQGGAMGGIAAKQPLYAGGKIIAGNKMAGIGENMARNNRQLKKTEVIYEANQAFLRYLAVVEKVKLAKNYQKLLKQVVDVVNDSYETGMVNRNELLKVKVKYNDATLGVQQAETGLKLAGMDLCRSIGVNLYSPIKVNDSIGNIAFDAASLEEVSVTGRAEYQLLEGQVEMAGQNVKMVKGDYLPTAGVSVNYNYLFVGIDGMDNYEGHGMSAMGSLKIPITHFGERKGKIKAAQADYNIKQLEMQQTEKLLQLEIAQARLNYMDAYTRIQMADEALKQADENMRICDDNYRLGMETIVNLLEAKAEWQKAYSNKIDALTDFKVKECNYLRVSNKLVSGE